MKMRVTHQRIKHNERGRKKNPKAKDATSQQTKKIKIMSILRSENKILKEEEGRNLWKLRETRERY